MRSFIVVLAIVLGSFGFAFGKDGESKTPSLPKIDKDSLAKLEQLQREIVKLSQELEAIEKRFEATRDKEKDKQDRIRLNAIQKAMKEINEENERRKGEPGFFPKNPISWEDGEWMSDESRRWRAYSLFPEMVEFQKRISKPLEERQKLMDRFGVTEKMLSKIK